MIKRFEDKTKLKDLCLAGHNLFDRMKKKGIPTVTAINGACLGGGLEWALKCDYRVSLAAAISGQCPSLSLCSLPLASRWRRAPRSPSWACPR